MGLVRKVERYPPRICPQQPALQTPFMLFSAPLKMPAGAEGDLGASKNPRIPEPFMLETGVRYIILETLNWSSGSGKVSRPGVWALDKKRLLIRWWPPREYNRVTPL